MQNLQFMLFRERRGRNVGGSPLDSMEGVEVMRLATHRSCTAVVILATVLFATAFADAATQAYKQTNLVSDGSAPAAFTDPNLKNPWGVAIGPGPFWVANQMTGTATL